MELPLKNDDFLLNNGRLFCNIWGMISEAHGAIVSEVMRSDAANPVDNGIFKQNIRELLLRPPVSARPKL